MPGSGEIKPEAKNRGIPNDDIRGKECPDRVKSSQKLRIVAYQMAILEEKNAKIRRRDK